MASRTLTVMTTDIKGFATRTSKGTRAKWVRLLERHELLLLPVVARYGGHVVRTLGDTFLLTFEDPTKAVLCGLMMQERLRQENAHAKEEPIEIRVAIHTGEVEIIDSDVFGEPVYIAGRLNALASPGNVWFSQSTYGAMQRSEVPTIEVGEFRLKGIPHKVSVYRVQFDCDPDLYKRAVELQGHQDTSTATVLAEGSFSSNLLHAQEQNRLMAPAVSRVGTWVLASACVLVLAQIGVFGWRAIQESRAVAEAAHLVESGALSDGMDRLEQLRAVRPDDSRITESLNSAVTQIIQALAAQSRFEEGLEQLSALEMRLPYLDLYDTLRRDLLLAQSDYRCLEDSDAAGMSFKDLVSLYPTDLSIQMHHAHCLVENDRDHDGIEKYLDVLEKEPAYASNNDLRELVQIVIRTWSTPRFQKILADLFLDLVGVQLSEGLYTPDDELRALRRNAFAVLTIKNPETVDSLRFWSIEMLTRQASDDDLREEMFGFFTGLVQAGVDKKLLARIPHLQSEVPILMNHDNQHAARIVEIFSVFFADDLELFLRNKLVQTHYSERGYRINARRILEKRDMLTPELEMEYHLASLQDHDGHLREHLVESVVWFAVASPQNRQAIPHLRIIEQEMIQLIQNWSAEGSASQTSPQKALRNASRSAIERMGG